MRLGRVVAGGGQVDGPHRGEDPVPSTFGVKALAQLCLRIIELFITEVSVSEKARQREGGIPHVVRCGPRTSLSMLRT